MEVTISVIEFELMCPITLHYWSNGSIIYMEVIL